MKAISKPGFKVKEVFSECISTVEDDNLKQALTNCISILEVGEIDFDAKFKTHDIYKISQNPIVLGEIDSDEMKKVYAYRMVNEKMPGRKYYNKIKLAIEKCPLCSVREVDTLDHYLPKMKYPIYAVTPINLIPSCFKCNKGKSINYPRTSEEQTLHPYYDNIENESWIKARVLQTNPISFDFYVEPPNSWSQVLKDRAENHFISYNINELFSFHANGELRGTKNYLVSLYNDHPEELKKHLLGSFKSRLSGLGVNSWQAVMYGTLLNDTWFCGGGVLI